MSRPPIPIPDTTTPTLPPVLLGHLIKKGRVQDTLLGRVNSRLKLSYQVEQPILLALNSIAPLLKPPMSSNSSGGGGNRSGLLGIGGIGGAGAVMPSVLTERKRLSLAMRWVLAVVQGKKFQGKRNLEQGLMDEFSAILNGTSSLYAKRYQYHKAAA